MFSMMTEEVKKSLAMQPERHNIILYGIETHVCVQQTAMDALEMGYNVHVLVDGVSSQRALDRTVAIKKMSDYGVSMTTTESIIFEIMRDQQHPKFKAILPTLKVPRPPQFEGM
jgi:isochorismate hydrolase